MTPRHVLALIGCAGLSTIALSDAALNALVPGYTSPFYDEAPRSLQLLLSDLVHGLTYAALWFVLRQEAPRFRRANRAARVLHAVLLGCFAAMAVAFVVVAPLTTLVGPPTGTLGAVWSVVGTALLAVVVLGSLVLGLALLRDNPLGLGGRVLAGVLPVLLLTVLLAVVVPAWAHPGYLETVINFGVALLGVRVVGGDAEISAGRRPSRTASSPG